MKKLVLSNAPNPDDARYRNNPTLYNRAVYEWMNETKSKIEQASKINESPLDQSFVVTSYSTDTALTGTSTGTDIANFICTLVASFTRKGRITPT